MSELHLVVDTQVILIGNRKSTIPCQPSHEELLAAFGKVKNLFLALDKGDKILHEYESKMGESSPARKWLFHVMNSKSYTFHERAKIPKKMDQELRKESFHDPDRKFIELGMATPTKILVAEEKIYTAKVCNILKKHVHVVVCSSSEACETIKAKPPCDCCV